MCTYSINGAWSKWENSPIIVETVNKMRPISVLPFPAISICPYTVFARNKFNFTAVYRLMGKLDGINSRNLTAFESKTMKLASQYCYDSVFPSVTRNFSDEYLDDSVWSAINEIAPAFNETFVFCKLFDKWVDCNKLFVPRTTERGLCYSFNTLNVYEMFTDE